MASHYTQTYMIGNAWTHDDYVTVPTVSQPANALVERIQFQTVVQIEPESFPAFPAMGMYVGYRLIDAFTEDPAPAFSVRPTNGADFDEANMIDWVLVPFYPSGYWVSDGSGVSYQVSQPITGVYDVAHHVPAGHQAHVQVAIWDGTTSGTAYGIAAQGGVRLWVRHNVM
jgi:hypothetical protein